MSVWRQWVGPLALGGVTQLIVGACVPSLYLGVRVLINLLAFAMGQWLLSTDRSFVVRQWATAWPMTGGTVCRGLLMVLVAEFMYRMPPPVPVEPLVIWTVHVWDQGAALLAVFGVLGLALTLAHRGEQNTGAMFSMLMRGAFAWWSVHWLWLSVGDPVLTAFREHPAQSTLTVVTLTLLLVLFKWLWPWSAGEAPMTHAATAMAMRPLMAPTPRDRHVVAVHEAGHALVYAALPRLPPSLKAEVRLNERFEGVHGWVKGTTMPHQLLSGADLHWRCLLDLAGMAAEQVTMGQVHQGNQSDQDLWRVHVTEWLRQHPTEVFYPSATNTDERELNQRKLEHWRLVHWTWLVAFMTDHRVALETVRDALLRQPTLDAAALGPLLAPVTWPADGPRPSFQPER